MCERVRERVSAHDDESTLPPYVFGFASKNNKNILKISKKTLVSLIIISYSARNIKRLFATRGLVTILYRSFN